MPGWWYSTSYKRRVLLTATGAYVRRPRLDDIVAAVKDAPTACDRTFYG